jgi:hypothetical protein
MLKSPLLVSSPLLSDLRLQVLHEGRPRPSHLARRRDDAVPAGEQGAGGEALAAPWDRARDGRSPWRPCRRSWPGAAPRNDTEIRRPPPRSRASPCRCPETWRFRQPFSRNAALDSSGSLSGQFLQDLHECGHGSVFLDPAELALGSQQARDAPARRHVAIRKSPSWPGANAAGNRALTGSL